LTAGRGKFDAFSTTLLYSKFQNHDIIRTIGESVSDAVGIPFFYEDFRLGWKEGVEVSRQMDLYRQSYCGCIFSERDRFYKDPSRPARPGGAAARS
jgi:predicted adenine nucleotide alpha hydrolase (AANH) superfamily ATPase